MIASYELLGEEVHKNVAVIPIKTPINHKVDLLTLKKGFELGLVDVKECEQSTVNTIIVENKSVAPLLLVDGEEIVGGDQNRIMDATKAVWDSIDELEMSRSFSSPTQAMSESYENAKSDLSEFMEVFEVVEGQTGVAVMIDGEVKGFEVFLNRTTTFLQSTGMQSEASLMAH